MKLRKVYYEQIDKAASGCYNLYVRVQIRTKPEAAKEKLWKITMRARMKSMPEEKNPR